MRTKLLTVYVSQNENTKNDLSLESPGNISAYCISLFIFIVVLEIKTKVYASWLRPTTESLTHGDRGCQKN